MNTEPQHMGDRPNVVLFAKAVTPNPGGIETYSNSVAQAWSELGYQVTVITQFSGPIGTTQRGLVKIINVGPGTQLAVFWRMLKTAWQIRNQLTPQIIHATTWRVAIPALLVFRKIPIVVTVHGREVTQMKSGVVWLMRQIIKRINKVIVISQTTLKQCLPFVPILSEKAVVSWNGLSYNHEAMRRPKSLVERSSSPCRLYTLCRLVERKNIDGALRALALVRSRGVEDWEYHIAGNGEERSNLESLTEQLGLADKVQFLGRISDADVAPSYRSADIFLHPQTSGRDGHDIEGFGLVIADAMSFGIPVIAGRDGAPSEYIKDGETACLTDGHDIEALANTIEKLIINREERHRIGENGRTWALENLTWRRHIERFRKEFNYHQAPLIKN